MSNCSPLAISLFVLVHTLTTDDRRLRGLWNNANGAVKMHSSLSFDKFARLRRRRRERGNYLYTSKCK